MAARFVGTVTIAAAMAISTLAAPSVFACGSAVADEVDEEAQLISRAQSALDTADYPRARRLATQIPGAQPRGRWIRAMSYVRDENATEQQIGEAVVTLRKIHASRGRGDIVSQVDLAEGLARLPNSRGEARELLEPLAQADLIGSPHAYASLVRIGSSLSIRLVALRRCRETADDAALCTRGFIETRQLAERKAADRWGPRLFTGLAGIGTIGTLMAAALCVRRRHRRSQLMAQLA